MKNQKTVGNLLLILTAMIWGTAFVFQRSGMERIEPITFNAVRMALSALVTGIVVLCLRALEKKGSRSPGPEEERALRRNTLTGGVCCGAFLAAASIFQQMGIVHTPAGKAGFITAMYMLLVPVINFLLFRKRNSLTVWLAVGIGVIGMYFLCVTEGFSLTRGDTLVCLCALMFSGHILCCDHFARLGNPVAVSAIQFAVCSLISAGAAFLLETPSLSGVLRAAVPILYCGVVSGGIGYTLQLVAQGFTEPATASLLMSLEAVFAVIAGAVLLKERMSGRELAGCVIMFAAILLVQLPSGEWEKKKL